MLSKLLLSLLFLLPMTGKGAIAHSDSLIVDQKDSIVPAFVYSDKKIREARSQTSLKRLDGDKIGRSFAVFGTPDLVKSLQMLPGVSSCSELMAGLYVRGGDGSDNLFLLDGVPMYEVSHLVGMFSSFNTDLIDYADFYKGGFPARYGGRLSSVVDVGIKEGSFDKWSGSASLGSIDGRFNIGGPLVKGKTSLNFGVRRTWTEVMQGLATAFIMDEQEKAMAEAFHYDFGDFNLKLAHKFSSRDKLTFSAYYGQDLLKAMIVEDLEDESFSNIDYNLRWGNTLGTLRYDKVFSESLVMDAQLFYTNYSSRMIFTTESSSAGSSELDSYFNLHENNLSRVYDIGLNANLYSKRVEGHHFRSGGSVILHTYDPTRSEGMIVKEDDVPIYNTESKEEKHYNGVEIAAYVEDEISISDRLNINIGLRDALYVVGGRAYNRIEPRAAVRFQANEMLSLKGSFSTMDQFTHKVSATYIDLPSNLWMPSTDKVKPMRSNQWVLGGELKLPCNLSLDVEAFYKTMDHLYEYTGINTMLPRIDRWEEVFEEGKGRAYGVEISAEYSQEKFYAAAYYTLSRSERLFETFYYDYFPDRNDNLHRLTLTASYRFSKRFELYAAWVYHSGNRFTGKEAVVQDVDSSYDIYGSPNNYLLPDYHRLDAGLNWHRSTRHGHERTLTLSVYNAYNHVNAMFGFVDEDGGRLIGHSYGIVPIIPSLSYTYRF